MSACICHNLFCQMRVNLNGPNLVFVLPIEPCFNDEQTSIVTIFDLLFLGFFSPAESFLCFCRPVVEQVLSTLGGMARLRSRSWTVGARFSYNSEPAQLSLIQSS